MELVSSPASEQALVQAYGPGQFKIGEQVYPRSILLFSGGVFQLDIESIDQLNETVLERVFLANPKLDILLVGYGLSKGQVDCQLSNALRNAAIGFDIMNTGAACRTYNVLALEERRVAAVVIPL